MADFEAYALGRTDSYDSSMDRVEMLRKKYEDLMAELSLTEDKVREYSRVKIHDGFAVMKLTAGLAAWVVSLFFCCKRGDLDVL